MTNIEATKCLTCIEGYHLGSKDNKCTKIVGCELSENENKCIECGEDYCLDTKKGTCEINYEIEYEGKKFYFNCNRTNKDGNGCEVCLDKYELKDGLCINYENCEEFNGDGNCIKCKEDEISNYCLNSKFGCMRIFRNNQCLNVIIFLIFLNVLNVLMDMKLTNSVDVLKLMNNF